MANTDKISSYVRQNVGSQRSGERSYNSNFPNEAWSQDGVDILTVVVLAAYSHCTDMSITGHARVVPPSPSRLGQSFVYNRVFQIEATHSLVLVRNLMCRTSFQTKRFTYGCE